MAARMAEGVMETDRMGGSGEGVRPVSVILVARHTAVANLRACSSPAAVVGTGALRVYFILSPFSTFSLQRRLPFPPHRPRKWHATATSTTQPQLSTTVAGRELWRIR